MNLKPPADKSLLDAVVEIARLGGENTLRWFRNRDLGVESKSDGTVVTEADRQTEVVVRDHIENHFPGSSVIGEEFDDTSGDGNLTWQIDPIDGTMSFIRGVPLYSTLIAVSDEHGPAAGCVFIPATGEMVSAGRGLGCFDERGNVARVSTQPGLDGACVSSSDVARWGDATYANIRAAGANIKGWGDGYGFMLAATGRIDAMIDLNGGKIWDFAPMVVIFEEAGGRFTNVRNEIDPNGPSGIATNGLLHDEVMGCIKPL